MSAPHLTVSVYLCSSRVNAQGKVRVIRGFCVISKSPSRQDGDEGVAGTDVRELENFYLSGLHLIAFDFPVLHKEQILKKTESWLVMLIL